MQPSYLLRSGAHLSGKFLSIIEISLIGHGNGDIGTYEDHYKEYLCVLQKIEI